MTEEKNKIIINYFGGSYGTFVQLFLTGKITSNNINFEKKHFHYVKSNTEIIIGTHENEKILDNLNVKITYKKNHIDLICRNKWHKLEEDVNFLKNSSLKIFNDYTLDIDQTSKEIITISFYKNVLLHGLTEWNKILNKNTVELPFVYFLLENSEWLKSWQTIFKKLKIDATPEYILEAHNIFNKTQKSLIQSHNFYKNLKWREQDVIGKGNYLGELYFQKHSQNTVPIDIVKYKDTKHMLSSWINDLDTEHAEL